MNNKITDNNGTDHEPEMSELMAAFNPEPPRAEEPVRFYWQDGYGDTAVQSAFES